MREKHRSPDGAAPDAPAGLRHDVPLAPYTTLELGGPARYLLEAASEASVIAALRWADAEGVRVTVLGGGSNLVVADSGFEGLVVVPAVRGIDVRRDGDHIRLKVAAGEPWDEVVARAVAEGWAGIECLAGIPGSSGATPIQNVGAYGQEVAEVIRNVDVLDCHSMTRSVISAAECGFGYRTSRFRREPGQYVILAVEMTLHAGGPASVRYPELQRILGADASEPSPRGVRDGVLELRRAKSMVTDADDPNRRSVGSFFVNPILSPGEAERVAERAAAAGACGGPEEMPRYPIGRDRVKVPAAWLIERAGFRRGYRRGAVGISSRHTLALVHHGGGTARELIALAAEIRGRVQERFGVRLHPEPVLLGFGAEDPIG